MPRARVGRAKQRGRVHLFPELLHCGDGLDHFRTGDLLLLIAEGHEAVVRPVENLADLGTG